MAGCSFVHTLVQKQEDPFEERGFRQIKGQSSDSIPHEPEEDAIDEEV